MRILFLGDVVGSPGRKIISDLVPDLIERERIDFAIANGENASAGKGIDEKTAVEIFNAGIDVITGGNHSWDKKDVYDYIRKEPCLLRPANYPEIPGYDVPGKGSIVVERKGMKLGILNLMGRVHMEPVLECPFQAIMKWEKWYKDNGVRHVLVDFHAEATSEKQAFGWFCAGKVSAVVGTHSHVQTADERILTAEDSSMRTAYITDAGMTGPYDSVIGMKRERSIPRFIGKMPSRYEPADENPGLHGVLIDLDEETGSAKNIKRISIFQNSSK